MLNTHQNGINKMTENACVSEDVEQFKVAYVTVVNW